MKTLIISDVHANIIALEAIWEKESDVDLIVCAGDLVDYGLYPQESIDWLIDKKVKSVYGNHDLAVINASENPDQHDATTWCMNNMQKLQERYLDYLKQLPETLIVDIDGDNYGITHAFCGYDIIRTEEAFQEFSQQRFSQDLQRIIFGHTHRREWHWLSSDCYWLNPGSVSYRRPDEDYRGAHYALIIDGAVSLSEVAYPVDELHQLVLASTVNENEKNPTYHWWAPVDFTANTLNQE